MPDFLSMSIGLCIAFIGIPIRITRLLSPGGVFMAGTNGIEWVGQQNIFYRQIKLAK
jgi:hypothetical protein